MKRSLLTRTIFVAVAAILCVYAVIGVPRSREELIANWQSNIRLGTDLRGGMRFDLQVA
jgi:preprotein translocase subunit SecD